MRKIILLSWLWAAISLVIFYEGMELYEKGLVIGEQMMCAAILSILLMGAFAIAFVTKVILKQRKEKD